MSGQEEAGEMSVSDFVRLVMDLRSSQAQWKRMFMEGRTGTAEYAEVCRRGSELCARLDAVLGNAMEAQREIAMRKLKEVFVEEGWKMSIQKI